MSDKILATFRIAPEEWEEFKAKASEDSTNASALVTEFIRWYIQGNRIDNDSSLSLDNLEEIINAHIDRHIDIIKESIDRHIDKKLDSEMSERLEVIEGKLIA